MPALMNVLDASRNSVIDAVVQLFRYSVRFFAALLHFLTFLAPI